MKYITIAGCLLPQIEHFLPNHGKGYVLKDAPVDLQKTEENSYKAFDYAWLPENLWRKYSFAAVFAKIVRTRTPVVTYHSREDQAKAVLMDNMPEPDFELRFYDGVYGKIPIIIICRLYTKHIL